MDFRKDTEKNLEDNCNWFNAQHLEQHARQINKPVLYFAATHEGVSEEDGLVIDDSLFMGLPSFLELAEGARVLALALDDATRREVQGERPAQVAYGRVAAGNRDELLAGKDVLGWS